MLNKIKRNNFGPLANLDWPDPGPIKLLIGGNGTGKTFLLKSIYSAMRTLEEYEGRSGVGAQMATQSIIESGMTFGPYPAGRCFYIEKSNTFADIQQGVRMAEFPLLRADNGKPPVLMEGKGRYESRRPEKR